MTNPDITKMNFKTDCIVAHYTAQSVFKIPDDIKQEEIDNYWIKWDVLHIEMKDGRIIDIQPMWGGVGENDSLDTKYPDEILIDEKGNQCCESDSEDDDDGDDEKDEDDDEDDDEKDEDEEDDDDSSDDDDDEVVVVTKENIENFFETERDCMGCHKIFKSPELGGAFILTRPSSYAGVLHFCRNCANEVDLHNFVY